MIVAICNKFKRLFSICFKLYFPANNNINTTQADITTASEKIPIELNCPYSVEEYSWDYIPSNPSISKDLFSGSNNFQANVTSSKATGYYNCRLAGSIMHSFHAISKFV